METSHIPFLVEERDKSRAEIERLKVELKEMTDKFWHTVADLGEVKAENAMLRAILKDIEKDITGFLNKGLN